MIRVLKKELDSFLDSLVAYVVIVVFLTGIGLLMWVFPETSVLNYGYADMDTLFSFGPYVFMFLIPAITMRTFAEERRAGTMELLLTKPLSDWQIILGKYFSAFLLVIFAIIPTLIYYYSVYKLGQPEGNVDSAGVFGSYLGLLLLGGVFVAVGIFSSAVSGNQIVAFIIAVFLCFLLYSGLGSFAAINDWGSLSLLLEQAGLLYHYRALGKGLVDSRNVIYLISVIVLLLALTRLIIGTRKW